MLKGYFTKWEKTLWFSSVVLITLSFLMFDRVNYLKFIASLIGTTSLIFIAKGNPIGQLLMMIFGMIYGYISYSYAYYGELITYAGMTAPMSLMSLFSWLKNPYKGNRAQVKISRVTKKDVALMLVLSIVVTVVLYFVLKHFGTANLIPSTFSVTTSFVAVFLSFKRSPYFALSYAVNDIVLIILWTLAVLEDVSYVSVLVCFVVFLANDMYSFINWRKIRARQTDDK